MGNVSDGRNRKGLMAEMHEANDLGIVPSASNHRDGNSSNHDNISGNNGTTSFHRNEFKASIFKPLLALGPQDQPPRPQLRRYSAKVLCVPQTRLAALTHCRTYSIHGCHNYATVGAVASIATKVPQLNILSEMRTAILIKKLKK